MLLPEKKSRLKCETKALDKDRHLFGMPVTISLCQPEASTSVDLIVLTQMSAINSSLADVLLYPSVKKEE